MAERRALAGVRVLVTRPAHQAQALCALIENAGGIAIRFPTIDIAPPRDPTALARLLARLAEFDLAIFVSPNAVTCAMQALHAHALALPPRLKVACIGAGSASALARFGINEVIVPTRTDSESLLALAPLQQVAGQRVLIFRGEGGRELLADTLRARGAQIEHAVCYRRARPEVDTVPLIDMFQSNAVDVVTVTSVDALRHLADMLDTAGRAALTRLPVITVSERVREACHALGLHGPIHVANAASDEALAATLHAWHERQKNL